MKIETRIMIVMIILTCLILACTMPALPGAKVNISPTPNQTLTALFAPPINISTATIVFPLSEPSVEAPTKTVTATTTSTVVTPTVTQTVTSTTTNTATNSATNTSWSPCYRSGDYFYADQITPVIDGVWEEWGTTQYPATFVVYGADQWVSEADLSSSFRVGWDSQYLYIGVKVGDDHYVQNAAGQELYKGDGVELLIDTNLCGDYYATSLSGDDFQLGISPGNPDVNGPREAFMWYPSSLAGSKPGVLISSVQSTGLYRVEAGIPWSDLGVSPWAGQTFGFALSVSDNDIANQNGQDTMVSSVSTRHLTNPTTWATLILR
jgi:hypothetical protein